MKSLQALRTLNPLFWEHKGKLFVGIFLIAITNILAVFAPALVAEGINSLRDANVQYIEPLSNAESDTERVEIFQQENVIAIPKVMKRIVSEIEDLSSIKSTEDLHKLVIAIAIFQALLYMITFLIKGVFLYWFGGFPPIFKY